MHQRIKNVNMAENSNLSFVQVTWHACVRVPVIFGNTNGNWGAAAALKIKVYIYMANDPPVWPSCVCQNVSCAHEKMSTNDQGGSGCYAVPALSVLPTRGKIFKDIFSGDFSLVVEVPLIHIWCCSCHCRRLTQQTHTKDSGKTYDTKSSFHDWFVAVNPNEHAPVFL